MEVKWSGVASDQLWRPDGQAWILGQQLRRTADIAVGRQLASPREQLMRTVWRLAERRSLQIEGHLCVRMASQGGQARLAWDPCMVVNAA